MTKQRSTQGPGGSTGGIAPTQTVAIALAAMEQLQSRTQGMPGLGVLSGRPGLGKTSALTRLAHPTDIDAVYIACRSFERPKTLVEMLLRELGVASKSHWSIGTMFEAALAALVESGRPLVVDEVDRIAKGSAIELLRDLHDLGQVPILMVGEQHLQRDLARYHERFHDRVLVWAHAMPPDLSDLDKLAALYAPALKLERDAKDAVLAHSKGVHRNIVTALHLISQRVATHGLDVVSAADLRGVL